MDGDARPRSAAVQPGVAAAVRRVAHEGLPLEAHPSRGQVLFFFVLGLLLTGGGALIFRWGQDAAPGFERIWHYGMAGLIGLFGVWVIADYGRRLLRRGPALVLAPDGVHDFTHGSKAVFVHWVEVGRVFVGEHWRSPPGGGASYLAHRFVSVDVTDPDALRARMGRGRFALLQVQRGQTGALVNVSENLLPEPAEHWVRIMDALAQELGRTGSGERREGSSRLPGSGSRPP